MGDIETKEASSHVIFSKIRTGKIGTTTNGSGPSPSPPTPPSGSPCCSWDGKYCGKTTDYCAANEAQCEDCKGNWCTDCLPPFNPATTAAPSCPGGSLSACLADCPAAIYSACAESCAARCSSLLV